MRFSANEELTEITSDLEGSILPGTNSSTNVDFKISFTTIWTWIKSKVVTAIGTANDTIRNALNTWLTGSTLSAVNTSSKYPINSTCLNDSLANYGIAKGTNPISDLNSMTTGQRVTWNVSTSNTPVTGYGECFQTSAADNNWLTQTAIGTGNRRWQRQNINGGGWSDWKEYATTDSLANYAKRVYKGTLGADASIDLSFLTPTENQDFYKLYVISNQNNYAIYDFLIYSSSGAIRDVVPVYEESKGSYYTLTIDKTGSINLATTAYCVYTLIKLA